ncbi:NAD(P)H-hydrate dehydratase [Fructilactobacillus fructivorans]|uniref:NAD(P)H-hydrate dehydratase n=1 Tax=Fructilactobacillus fructivorans TaxID=1614 RepID=UPI00070543D0|nr:NAD(P)H-hydrate dehydratase [Fructilactobacillus fructivorans]
MKKIDKSILTKTIRIRPKNSFKGTYGKIALIGGNESFGGAIIMSSLGAVYSGAGLTTTITDPTNQSSLHAWLPEAMFADYNDTDQMVQLIKSMKVITIGSGLGTDDHSCEIMETVFDTVTPDQTLLIDGSAITMVAERGLKLPDAKLIFTPHQMEWQRLSGIKMADQTEERNKAARDKIGGIVVLKSDRTEVYTPNEVYQNTTGTPAQATGGMGDTLAGIIGGFVAQFDNEVDAVLAAVYSHSAIADELANTQYVVLPHQISKRLPKFMHEHEA